MFDKKIIKHAGAYLFTVYLFFQCLFLHYICIVTPGQLMTS